MSRLPDIDHRWISREDWEEKACKEELTVHPTGSFRCGFRKNHRGNHSWTVYMEASLRLESEKFSSQMTQARRYKQINGRLYRERAALCRLVGIPDDDVQDVLRDSTRLYDRVKELVDGTRMP